MSLYKPIVKWAGGKSKMLSQLSNYFPKQFINYHEPFVGGGAVFFYLFPVLINRKCKAYLSDSVEELINLYVQVKESVDELIYTSRKHIYEKQYYYNIRAINPVSISDLQRASRILYLNRTCFNGLYRVNKKGQFNVSFGDYTNPVIVNEKILRNASNAFQFAELFSGDFELVLNNVRAGDFVYLDPPYVPLSVTSNFTGYTSDSFGIDNHKRLRKVFDILKAKGCYVMLSNSNADFVKELYSDCNIKTVNSARSINSDTSKRGSIKELCVLSYSDDETQINSQVL